MTSTDILILIMIAGGLAYGLLRGVRPALFLLITLLASLLGLILLTAPMERLLIDLSPVDIEAYADAPAVAVFILEGEDGFAYLAALIPIFFTIFGILGLILGGALTRGFLTEASRGIGSRIIGSLAGFASGTILALLFAVQLIRLPWPPAGNMFRDSLLISALNSAVYYLLPGLAGGL